MVLGPLTLNQTYVLPWQQLDTFPLVQTIYNKMQRPCDHVISIFSQ